MDLMVFVFHNSLIKYGNIPQIVSRYMIYIFYNKPMLNENYMKIVNNLINENIFTLKVRSLRQDG